jgi:putative ABC transport system substrate-binding protein
MIARRDFVCAVVGTLLAAPLGVAAQQSPRVYRIGFLAFGSETAAAPYLKAFEEGLREFGYVNGRNIAIERRFAEGKTERLPGLAAELVGFPVDVIMPGPALAYFPGSPAVAASRLTKTIPIVMFHADPVGSGLVASLARPGGNITGLSLFNPAIVGKQLALINEVVPRAGLVAVLRNPTNSAHARSLSELEVAARSVQVQLQVLAARKPDEFETAFAAMTRERARAALVLGDSMFFLHRARIADLAKRQRLPTMSVQREHAEAGGLMAYGANLADIYRRAATYVDKILKGAKPADLPVEQPTKFELVINMKTAKALGLTLSPSIVARADEVIQ